MKWLLLAFFLLSGCTLDIDATYNRGYERQQLRQLKNDK
jgi:hypothetical protein